MLKEDGKTAQSDKMSISLRFYGLYTHKKTYPVRIVESGNFACKKRTLFHCFHSIILVMQGITQVIGRLLYEGSINNIGTGWGDNVVVEHFFAA